MLKDIINILYIIENERGYEGVGDEDEELGDLAEDVPSLEEV